MNRGSAPVLIAIPRGGGAFPSALKGPDQEAALQNRDLALTDVANYIVTPYNRTRRHSHLGGLGPEQFEKAHKQPRPGVH
jgi:hypothetical protein